MSILKTSWIRASIGLVFVVVIIWLLTPAETEQGLDINQEQTLTVTVLNADPQQHQLQLSVVGTTQPRWPVTLISSIEGRVLPGQELPEPSSLLQKDTSLLLVEDTFYQSDLGQARASLAQAELELARIKHEQTVAKQVATKPLSEFGRLEPHVAAATSQVAAAKANLETAKLRLAETKPKVPFDAIVLQRFVVPGQWLNVGDPMYSLASSDSLDIHVQLSTEQVAQLGGIDQETPIAVGNNAGESWPATLRFLSPSYDAQTRQLMFVLKVPEPFAGQHRLLPEAMVNVGFTGKSMQNVVTAPASVVTADGFVWVVEQGKLAKSSITIVEESTSQVHFKFDHAPAEPRILVRFPLSSMLEGQKVNLDNPDITVIPGSEKQ